MFSSSSEPAADIPPQQKSPAAHRLPGRPFERGRSGNPSGKPKMAPDPGQLARKHTVAAIKALARALTGPDVQASVHAAQVLLNEGYGLPRQHVALGLPRLSLYFNAPPPDDGESDRPNGEARTGRAWDA